MDNVSLHDRPLEKKPPLVTAIDDAYQYDEVRSLHAEYVTLPDGTETRTYAVNADGDSFNVIGGSTGCYDNTESGCT